MPSVLSQKFAEQECRSSPPCFVAVLAWCPTKLRAASRLAPRSAFLRRVGLVRVAALFNEPLTQDTSSLQRFKRRALAQPGVKDAYDALEDEFAFLDEVLKARLNPGSRRLKSPSASERPSAPLRAWNRLRRNTHLPLPRSSGTQGRSGTEWRSGWSSISKRTRRKGAARRLTAFRSRSSLRQHGRPLAETPCVIGSRRVVAN